MPGRLEWQHVEVDGRPAAYGVGGEGPPFVFVHGWGLSGRAYRAALQRLVARGLRVWAPTLPPNEAGGLAGYACWLDAFCGTVCHSVMHPEYTTYQASPHARVGCAGCHIATHPSTTSPWETLVNSASFAVTLSNRLEASRQTTRNMNATSASRRSPRVKTWSRVLYRYVPDTYWRIASLRSASSPPCVDPGTEDPVANVVAKRPALQGLDAVGIQQLVHRGDADRELGH